MLATRPLAHDLPFENHCYIKLHTVLSVFEDCKLLILLKDLYLFS